VVRISDRISTDAIPTESPNLIFLARLLLVLTASTQPQDFLSTLCVHDRPGFCNRSVAVWGGLRSI
jgi:hypothetical protein